MRATAMFALIPAMLLAAACSGNGGAGVDDELEKDLALAASDGLGMAPVPTTSVVSALEAGRQEAAPKPQTRKAPRKATTTARPQRPVAEPAPVEAEVEVAESTPEPAPEPTTVAEAPAPVAEEPIATPRPRPIPLPSPATEPRDAGPDVGGVIGTVIGVVIRGGGVGDDHCDPRTDGRRRRGGMTGTSPIPGTIIRGIPSGIPITPMVPRMGAPAQRGGIAVNERLPETARGGRIGIHRQ